MSKSVIENLEKVASALEAVAASIEADAKAAADAPQTKVAGEGKKDIGFGEPAESVKVAGKVGAAEAEFLSSILS